MWATIPFLATMIVALLTITYVPSITAVSVPEPERTGTMQVLTAMVHSAAEEGRAVKEVTLVDASGTVLKGSNGQPVVRKLADCAALTDDAKRDTCQALFFDVSGCKTDPKPDDCAHKKIADWTVSNMNGDALDQSKAIIVVDSVPLVTSEGAPVKDKAGQPVVKQLAECAKLEGSYQETCKQLFIDVSSCKISPPDSGADGCIADKVGSWVSDNASGSGN
jgi:hypothetical protein